MLTKQDCVNIGRAIAEALYAEKDSYSQCLPSVVYPLNGMTIRALGNIWHGVFTAKQRAHFDYNYENFSKLVDFNK
jgi:hypothetical protein